MLRVKLGAFDKLKRNTTNAASARSPSKAATKAANITSVLMSISLFCNEINDWGKILQRPSSKANKRKLSPVIGTLEHSTPRNMSKAETSTIKWRLCERTMSRMVGVTGWISKFPCPSNAAPNPARFNFIMTESGVLHRGQWTMMQIFWNVFIDTLSTPGSWVTIRSIKRTSESQQRLRTLKRVLMLSWSLHSPMGTGSTSTCSVCVQHAQESWGSWDHGPWAWLPRTTKSLWNDEMCLQVLPSTLNKKHAPMI